MLKLSAQDEYQVYVHVPFCASRCIYCDFYTFGCDEASVSRQEYLQALYSQIDHFLPQLGPSIKTIYFGGGTPSILGLELPKIIKHIKTYGDASALKELSVEANPESLSEELIIACLEAGVTRFSLGVQSFNDEALEMLARPTKSEAIYRAIALLQKHKATFSIDLIAGIPGVDKKLWEETLNEALKAKPSHISLYALSVEEGTPLDILIKHEVIQEPNEDEASDQLLAAQARFIQAGFEHYEISNYALPGHESKHNLGYWQGRPYIGFGPGAASMLYENEDKGTVRDSAEKAEVTHKRRIRFVLHDSLEEFVAMPKELRPLDYEILEGEDLIREDLMLGMRVMKGVALKDLASIGFNKHLNKFLDNKIVEIDCGWLRFSPDGWLLGNEVFEAIWRSD